MDNINFVESKDFKKKAVELLSSKLIKVESDEEIVSLVAIAFRRYGITSFDIQGQIDKFRQYIGKEITYIAMNQMYGCPLVAFFHNDFYSKYRIALNKYRIVSICAFNGMDADSFESGSCYVRNINGVYYYCLF